MYRLLFARDFFACRWKSLICIRPIDRHAGRALLGLRSHRDLISGRVHIDRLGRQILGAYFPFHAFSLSRTPLRSWVLSSNTNYDRISWRVKRPFVFEDTPGHPGQLIAKATANLLRCIRSDARVSHSPKLKSGHRLVLIRMTLLPERRACANIGFPAWIFDKDRSTSGAVLPWNQTNPGSKVTTSIKSLSSPYRCKPSPSRSSGRYRGSSLR